MMWFSKRARNRMYRNDLRGMNATLRTKVRNQRQTRRAGIIAACACFTLALVWGGWIGLQKAFRMLFTENDSYQITSISVENKGETLKPERVQAYLKIHRGMNLLSLDIKKIRQEIEALPMVEKSEVSRDLPDKLVIHITERIPLASVSTGVKGVRYQIDSQGVVMDLFPYQSNPDIRKRLQSLPRIDGASLSDLKIGRVTPSREVMLALQVIQKSQEGIYGLDLEVESIQILNRGMIEVQTSEGARIKLRDENLDQQLRRLVSLMLDAKRQMSKLYTVDLTLGRDVPTTLATSRSIP